MTKQDIDPNHNPDIDPNGQSVAAQTSALSADDRHAMRTPLNQIIGYSQILQEVAREQGHGIYLPDLGKIEVAAHRLSAMVQSIGDGTPMAQKPEESVLSAESLARERQIPSLPPAAPNAKAVQRPASRGAILLVDDNEGNRDMLRRSLSKRGYGVATAAGGKECLQKIQREGFDLVLLDIVMPDMGGIEVLETLRTMHSASDLPVIIFTARDASEDVVRALQVGANDYVTKPTDMSVVLARVASQLSLKRARDEVQQLNRRLTESHDRIAHLIESSPQAMLDFEAWATHTASEVAAVINANEIAVWALESDRLDRLSGSLTPPVTIAQVKAAVVDQRRALITSGIAPVMGLSGEVLGALVVSRENVVWGDVECRLVESVARQLGGALENVRMRKDLADANVRRRATRQDMLARGIDVLQICPECGRCYDQTITRCSADGATLDSPRLMPFRLYGIYRFVRMLRTAGEALVFRAIDEKQGRDAAVKVIKPEHFSDQSARVAFEREMRIVGQVNHPAVATLYDVGELDEGSLFVVMEWMKGPDLGEVVGSMGRGSPAQVARLLRQGAAALGAVHRAGLIHGDIKPSNVFLLPTADGFDVRIADFRGARRLFTWQSLLSDGQVVGSPAFMSPEQMRGEPTDTRSDVYSFAAVALEALVGRHNRGDQGLVQVFLDALFCTPLRPSDVLQEVMPEIDDAFQRALSKSVSERPLDVEQWVDSFAELLDQLPTQEVGWRLAREPVPASEDPGAPTDVTTAVGWPGNG
jgi:eukaryotic-like serine/threonine-protein kinase